MTEFEKSMEKIFDVPPVENAPVVQKQSLPKVSSDDLSADLKDAYEQSKDNLQELIEKGKDAMEEILVVAKAGQHPRAFEVFGGILKNMVDANKELLNIQKQMREMEGVKKEVNNTNIDKAIFVGTPAELNKLLKDKKDD